MVIPIACAVPVIAPKTKGFFIIGTTAFVKVAVVANPIPTIKPRKIACPIELILRRLFKIAIPIDAIKHLNT